ncbi:MAG TPA: hypothetical protein VN832_09135 [Stellaceae bacterium]|nr:hypothetical protein [Stellaceae bacterium]
MRIRSLGRTIATAVALSALLGTGSPVGAAIGHCFRAPEIEAQEAVQYQAKLMVLSDTCGAETYRRFTVRNREPLVHYQEEMIEHFRRLGERHAERIFDNFLTGLANKVSLSTGREPLTRLCGEAAEFLAQADTIDRDQFRHIVTAMAAERRNDYLRCTE